MSFHEHLMVIEAFIESQFNYFLLIWIFRSRRLDTTRIQKDTKKIQQGAKDTTRIRKDTKAIFS